MQLDVGGTNGGVGVVAKALDSESVGARIGQSDGDAQGVPKLFVGVLD